MDAGVWWRRGWRHTLDLVLPARCLVCAEAVPGSPPLCVVCAGDLPALHAACARCALPLPGLDAGRLCGRCQRIPPPQASCTALYRYEAPIDRLLTAHKFAGDLAAGSLLAELLAAHPRVQRLAADADLLLAMPLHRQRLRARGYNQVVELLRVLARQSGTAHPSDLLRRERATLAQSDLNAGQRRRNLRGAFRVTRALSGQRVLLVDDVVTTGTTVAEAARCLLAAGAGEVHVLALARVAKRTKGV